jgi:hypothetical protein
LQVDTDGPGNTAIFTEVAVIFDDASLGTHPTSINILYTDNGTETAATV